MILTLKKAKQFFDKTKQLQMTKPSNKSWSSAIYISKYNNISNMLLTSCRNSNCGMVSFKRKDNEPINIEFEKIKNWNRS
jgi:hypothetical protein